MVQYPGLVLSQQHGRRVGRWLGVVAMIAAIIGGGRVSAQQPQPADAVAINQAIQNGVSYLRQTQNPGGGWGKGTKPGSDGGWAVGYACLAGLTLIECGVPTSDPGLQAAAQGVRSFILDLDNTYEVSLAIMFLDRMGEKNDRKWIQMLAGRLMMGQSPTGGWGYKVPNRTKADVDVLLAALRRLLPPQSYDGPSLRARPSSQGLCIKTADDRASRPAPPAFDPDKARKAVAASLPPTMQRLALFLDLGQLLLTDPKDKGSDPYFPTTDNSNTHFAMLGLWTARKYDVPTDRSFALLANRWRTSQGSDGTWGYPYTFNGQNGGPPSMTCVALLGLAIAHVLNADPSVRPEKDPRVINAFAALSRQIGDAAGRIDGRPTPESVGGLYFLWGMERIAVLYDLRQLDKKDWYLWGAEILLCHQSSDGSWSGKGGYPGENIIPNTCLALLFLKRANLLPDLSRRLTVDASALTQKLTTAPPKPVVTTPPPPTPVTLEMAPPPRPLETKPKTESAPVVQVMPTSTESPPAPKPASKLPWIIVGILLALVGGGCIAFAIVKRKSQDDSDEDEDEEKPKKKKGEKSGKGKKKPKSAKKAEAVEDEED